MGLQKSTPKRSFLPNPYSSSRGEKVIPSNLCPRAASKASDNRGSANTTRQRILFSTIPRQEEVRGLSAGSRPEETQQVHQSRVVQDGKPAVYPPGHKLGRLDALHRSPGCLPTHSNSSGIPKVPAVLGGPGTLSISKPPFRDLYGTQNIYKGSASSNSLFEGEGSKGPPLPGRHSSPLKQPGITCATSRDLSLHPNESGLDNQLAEEQHSAYPEDGLPGSRAGHLGQHGRTAKGEVVPTNSEGERCGSSIILTGQSIPQPAGVLISNHSNGQVGAMEYQTSASLLPVPVGRMVHVPIDSHLGRSQIISTVVDPPRQPQQMQTDSHSPSGGSDFGRQSGGMGGTLPTLCSSGPLVLQNQGCCVKRPRDEGSLPSPLGIQLSSERETGPHPNG